LVVVFECDLLLLEEECDVFLALLVWLVLDFEEVVFLVLAVLVVLDFVELVLVVAIAGLTASNATRRSPSCG